MIGPEYIPIRQEDLKDIVKTVMETTEILAVKDDADALVKRGIALCKAGMYEECMHDFARATSINPFYAFSQVGYAMTQEYMKFIDNSQKLVQDWQAFAKLCGANI
ncbi:MAG: tetratricopeptide repeat protein [Candidatus Woesearchaeota archaeon]